MKPKNRKKFGKVQYADRKLNYFFLLIMNSLRHRPNLLYLIYVRFPKIALLNTCPKLLRDIYRKKLLNARTTIFTETKTKVFSDGVFTIIKCKFDNGKRIFLHREDGSAYIKKRDGIIIIEKWCFNGKLHRRDGPAVVRYDIEWNEWWQNGIQHRDNAPACESFDGKRYEWWNNGLQHRDNGPAEVKMGIESWYKHGEFHRIGGPAVIQKNLHEWCVDGNRHRIGGPAIHYLNMPWKNQYWINGEQLKVQGKKKKYITWVENGIQVKFIIPKQFI